MDYIEENDPWNVGFEETEADFPYDPTDDSGEFEEQEQEESEQEETTDSVDTEDSSDEQVNISYFLANALKEKGIIEVEDLPEDISEEDVINLYSQAHEQRIRQAAENELVESLQTRGITDEHLTMAMAIANGYSPDMLLEQNRYKAFADLKNSEDVDRSTKETVIREWLKTRNFYPDEIDRRMEELEIADDTEFDKDFNRAVEKFDSIYQDFRKTTEQQAFEREREALERKKYNQSVVNNVFQKSEIAGEKLSPTQLKEFERSLFHTSEVVEIGGQPYMASKFDKFILDFQNNIETQLLAFKLFQFRELDKKIIEQEAEAKAEESLFSKIKSQIEKKGSKIDMTKKKSADGRTFVVSKNAKVVQI